MSLTATTDTIYQASDLNRNGRAILSDARAGRARVRDRDGLSLVMVRESQLGALEVIAAASASYIMFEVAFEHSQSRALALKDYGDWTWLRVLDREDQSEFLAEIREALSISTREIDAGPITETLQAWQATAQALSATDRSKILLGQVSADDFVAVDRPNET